MNQSHITLFIFPYAGGSEFSYPKFTKSLQNSFDVKVIAYAGRGSRVSEPLSKSLHDLVSDSVDQIVNSLNGDYICIGHSFGSLVLYEAMKRLRNDHMKLPQHVFMFGRHAPSVTIIKDELKWHLLPENEFQDRIIKIGGIPEDIRYDKEFLSFFMPIIKNDIMLMEEYVYEQSNPFDLPILLLNGIQDPAYYSGIEKDWQRESTINILNIALEGGHFFAEQNPEEVAQEILKTVNNIKP